MTLPFSVIVLLINRPSFSLAPGSNKVCMRCLNRKLKASNSGAGCVKAFCSISTRRSYSSGGKMTASGTLWLVISKCPSLRTSVKNTPSPSLATMSDKTLSHSLPGWLILMGALNALAPLSIDMYLPAFPAIAQGLAATHADVERTLAAYLIGLSLSQLVYGPLADCYGRKPTLVAGLLLYIAASLGCAFADDIASLTFWRIAQAIGGACGIAIPRAVVRDHYDTQEAARALSMLMLVMGLAPILAPLIGGQMLPYTGWRSLFFFMAGSAALLLAIMVATLRESLPSDRVTPLSWRTTIGNYRELLAHRRFVMYSLVGGMGSAGMFAYIAGSPRVFIEHFGVSPKLYGLFFGLNAMALIVGSQLSARLLRRRPPSVLLRHAQIGMVVAVIALLALTLSDALTLPLLMLGLLVFMGSQGFVSPNAAALALADQGRRLGVASALLGTLQLGCGALAGLLVSALPLPGALPLTLMLATCGALSWAIRSLARRESDHAESDHV